MKFAIGTTAIISLCLGAILYLADTGWFTTLLWPGLIWVQAYSWFTRGRVEEVNRQTAELERQNDAMRRLLDS
jgi:hypothetical protein